MVIEQSFLPADPNDGHHQRPNSKSYNVNLRIVGKHDAPTIRLFGALQGAYTFFKEHLFEDKLMPVVLALNRKAYSLGYYLPLSWLDDTQENILFPDNQAWIVWLSHIVLSELYIENYLFQKI